MLVQMKHKEICGREGARTKIS